VLWAQHPVDLAEHAVDVVHGDQPPHGQHRVDGVGPDEGELGEGSVVQLDLHLLALAGGAGVGDLIGGLVDPDDLRALAGQRDRVVTGTAAEVEHALAVHVAEELQRVLPRHVGPVRDDVGGEVETARAGDGEALMHRCSLPPSARLR
jgi:hypothetical protein